MKTMTMNQTCRPVYPNAASRRYHLRKLLDTILTLVTAAGLTVTILFMLLLLG